jgi:hypothetical protein
VGTWLYDKNADRDGPLQSSPGNTAVQEHFYSVILPDGTRDTRLDDLLRDTESASAPIIAKLLDRQPLSYEERDLVAHFMGLSMVRVPAYIDAFVKSCAAMEKETMRLLARRPEFIPHMMARLTERGEAPRLEVLRKVQKIFAEGTFELHDPTRGVALQALGGIATLGATFCEMSWTIFTARGGRYPFVTGDNPVWFESPTAPAQPGAHALLAPGIEVSFPLSRGAVLVAGWGGPPVEYLPASDSLMSTVNHRTIAAAQRWVYAPVRSDALLNLVRRYRGSGRQAIVNSFETAARQDQHGRQTAGFVRVMTVPSGTVTPRRSLRPPGRTCVPDRRQIAVERMNQVRAFRRDARADAAASTRSGEGASVDSPAS